jgi:hypothetical protein
MSEELSARIALLDNQIVDSDEIPIGRVDDLEITPPARGGRPRVAALLTGSEALGKRLNGGIGRMISAISGQFRSPSPEPGPTRVDPSLIDELEPQLKLKRPLRDLDGVADLERWLSENVIQRLPGGGHADL